MLLNYELTGVKGSSKVYGLVTLIVDEVSKANKKRPFLFLETFFFSIKKNKIWSLLSFL